MHGALRQFLSDSPLKRPGELLPVESPLTAANVLVSQTDWLREIVQSRVSDRTTADDVMQEVAVAAVRNREHFDSVEDVKSWLYRVSVRQVALIERREGRQRQRLKRLGESRPSSISPDYLRAMEEDETSCLEVSLAQLRDDDRHLLLQYYRDRKRCLELAEQYGVAESTIQSRLLRARRRLRKLMQQRINQE